MSADEQPKLFEIPEKWRDAWAGMPEYEQKDQEPFQSINVHLRNEDDRRAFAELVNQRITSETQYIWYPKAEARGFAKYTTAQKTVPKYPVYIISKGRWESRLTARALEAIDVPYRICVEPQEYEQYASVIEPAKIFVLPFSNLGQGSIPARNWVWEHACSINSERHWILDDNIDGFIRQHQNQRLRLESGVAFRAIEDFADRYENIALAGPNYRFFAPTRSKQIPPFYWNTRVYSCILIRNELPYRWRGRYNEDTDLCIRALKDGWCTVLFNAIKINKQATMTMKGGNTDELYAGDGRYDMAKSLKDQHPDIVYITKKWDRWQHHVNYQVFKKNIPTVKTDINADAYQQDYGFILQES